MGPARRAARDPALAMPGPPTGRTSAGRHERRVAGRILATARAPRPRARLHRRRLVRQATRPAQVVRLSSTESPRERRRRARAPPRWPRARPGAASTGPATRQRGPRAAPRPLALPPACASAPSVARALRTRVPARRWARFAGRRAAGDRPARDARRTSAHAGVDRAHRPATARNRRRRSVGRAVPSSAGQGLESRSRPSTSAIPCAGEPSYTVSLTMPTSPSSASPIASKAGVRASRASRTAAASAATSATASCQSSVTPGRRRSRSGINEGAEEDRRSV